MSRKDRAGRAGTPMNGPATVCHVSTGFPPFPGALWGRPVWEESRSLVAAGWRVVVVAPHAPGSATRESVDGVEVRRFRYSPERWERLAYGAGIPVNLRANRWLWLLVPVFLAAGIVSAVRHSRGADILHAHWTIGGLMAWFASRLRRIPYVVTFRGTDVMRVRGILRWVSAFVARGAARIIVISRTMEEEVRKIADPGKTVRLPPGIVSAGIRRANAEGGPPVRIVAVGRVYEIKGYDILVEALRLLCDRQDWECVIAGDGPDVKKIRDQAREAGLGERVCLVGLLPHDEVERLLSSAHIVAAPSRQESFGVSALEASAAGLPVVATRDTGFEDVLVHEETGLLVPQEDPPALAAALARLLDSPELRASMGRAGIERAVREFSQETITRRLIDLYGCVVAARATRRP